MGFDSFDSTWNMICSLLTPRPELYHWSAAGRAKGHFAVTSVDRNGIGVRTAEGPRFVPRRDFAAIFPYWDDYVCRKVPRFRLRDFNVNTTYTISIFHWLTLQSNPKPNVLWR